MNDKQVIAGDEHNRVIAADQFMETNDDSSPPHGNTEELPCLALYSLVPLTEVDDQFADAEEELNEMVPKPQESLFAG